MSEPASRRAAAPATEAAVAVVGMAGRFPGARDVDELWRNLAAGRDGITVWSDRELRAAGVPDELLADPRYVKARGVVDGVELFDASFFGYAPREAEVMDPQHRLFLECAWEALEDAACDPARFPGRIGVFGGSGFTGYLIDNVLANPEIRERVGDLQIAIGNERDALTSKVSYKLGLRGPSLSLQTFCSTSLVAVHVACQSLLDFECDAALAGGVAIDLPQERGYLSVEGGILSPRGRCRTFDAAADGSVMGNGVGLVVLKRLDDALADGDAIRAVILGSAINNDGERKAGYTAPARDGQAAVIAEALAAAGVAPATLDYVEAHGTGTPLGDAVELAAMKRAFGETPGRAFCALGSAKTHFGHLDRAAGVAGLIKTVLALEKRQIPPSLHFERADPEAGLDDGPFYVNTALRDWRRRDGPRRAGVSSFGIGGTNAHVVLEEAPRSAAEPSSRPAQLLVLSAKTESALDAMTARLAEHLRERPGLELADVAWTLQIGRSAFNHRRIAVCGDLDEAAGALETRAPGRVFSAREARRDRPVTFLFPGLGDHYPGMGRELYDTEPRFRATVDRCSERLRDELGLDLRRELFAGGEAAQGPAQGDLDLRKMLGREAARPARLLDQTWLAQTAVFVLEYALADLLIRRGVRPRAMLGYSLGEYVAACLAGVFSLADALALVARRARRIHELPAGAMLAVSLPEKDLRRFLDRGPESGGALSLAAVNGPAVCVLAGPPAAVEEAEGRLVAEGVACRRLATTHAFHSSMLSPLAADLEALVGSFERRAPEIPFVSNLTGTWITEEQARDPAYWARHMVKTVRFGDGLGELLADGDRLFVEVGPGQSLGSFVQQHPDCRPSHQVLATLRHEHYRESDAVFLLASLGKLWLAGVEIDWPACHQGRRRRLPLPTYPFERRRFWIDPPSRDTARAPAAREPAAGSRKLASLDDWFYQAAWTPAPERDAAEPAADGGERWMLLVDAKGVGDGFARHLRQLGHRVTAVTPGDAYRADLAPDAFTVRPGAAEDFREMLASLRESGRSPGRVVHLWSLTGEPPAEPLSRRLNESLDLGFYSLLFLTQALAEETTTEVLELTVAADGLQAALPEDPIDPAKAPLLGLCEVLPQELPSFRCRTVDLGVSRDAAELLAAELTGTAWDPEVAFRDPGGAAGERRWVRSWKPLRAGPEPADPLLRPRGTYLVTGGLGEVGYALAELLARELQARLVLVGRTALPPRESWDARLGDGEGTRGDAVALKLRRILALEAAGAEVLALSADVADAEQMHDVLARCRERFGDPHGVIHGAGIVDRGAFTSLQKLGRSECEVHFRPKIRGALALAEAVADLELDFCVLQSSLSSVLGGLGFGAYAAANLFLDAFAGARDRASATRWISLGWDTWRTSAKREGDPLGATISEYEMSREEGVAAFGRILSLPATSHVVVSTGPLAERIAQWQGSGTRTPAAAPGARRDVRRETGTAYVPASGQLERQVAGAWREVLGVDRVGLHDNFFDLGGNSLIGIQVLDALRRDLGVQLSAVTLFEAPTVVLLAEALADRLGIARTAEAGAVAPAPAPAAGEREDVAIIGMAGRFPGAADVDAFWHNLRAGVESLATFSDDELVASGIDPEVLADPAYVKKRPVLDDVDLFDGRFFGYSPHEATFMDPQHRLFLECSWHALENAGYDPFQFPGAIGLYAGSNLSTYMLHFAADREILAEIDPFQVILGNDKDSLPTRVSYKLNLTGPSLAVQTYCSTSLVATHLAVQSLASRECDLALAGGVSVRVPQKYGYLYQQGGQDSADGHTRAFDANATGTVFGDGVSIVVLKRLSEAVADGDSICAVIKGSAVNNDGSRKAGFTAPSVEGQAKAVELALAKAGVDPGTIGFVEAHGSATPLGDPIEVAALGRAFRRGTAATGFCALGSVKSNVGHLDRAAGTTSLIKAALALRHGLIPPSLHFDAANPECDLAATPFYVNTEPVPWTAGATPRRAGVNSLGVGGTNAHLVLEEAPATLPSGPSRPWQLLLASAKTGTALERIGDGLRACLTRSPAVELADVCFTLQVGRKALEYRRVVLCRETGEAVRALASGDADRVFSHHQPLANPRPAFLFPGLGDHYPNMGRGLYENEPTFRRELDRCAEILRPHLGRDLTELIYPASGETGSSETGTSGTEASGTEAVDLRRMLRREGRDAGALGSLGATAVAQPAVFAFEYALAQVWLEWGVRPDAMIGYSLGEYVAACIAGVLSLDDALAVVAGRARLIAGLPAGAMLAVALPEAETVAFLDEARLAGDLALAALNGEELSVVAGAVDAVTELERRLGKLDVAHSRLATEHAFHSPAMVAIAEPFLEILDDVTWNLPRIPWVSNVTGRWISPEEATDPGYWVRHLRGTVRFHDGLGTLLEEPDRVFLEIGPGQNLGSFLRQHPGSKDHPAASTGTVFASTRNAYERRDDSEVLLTALGKLWLAGVEIDWRGFARHESRRRIALPGYPFERRRYWVEPRERPASGAAPGGPLKDEVKEPDLADWFYLPVWKQAPPETVDDASSWLLFLDGHGLGERVAERLERRGLTVFRARPGAAFGLADDRSYTLDPRRREDYQALVKSLRDGPGIPSRLAHLWTVGAAGGDPCRERLPAELERGFDSLLFLAQALGDLAPDEVRLTVVTSHAQSVLGEAVRPEKTLVRGPCQVIPQEYERIACRSVDLLFPEDGASWSGATCELLTRDLLAGCSQPAAALRGGQRWVEVYDRHRLGPPPETGSLRDGGVYLITGGLGGIGLAVADHLARRHGARLVLLGRAGLPPRETWDEWVARKDDDLGRKVRRVKALEARGAEVLVLSADVADEERMRAAIERTLERFGALHGVFHAAGVPGAGIIQLKSPDMAARVMTPKVRGTLVLDAVLEGLELDFLVLFSSIASVTGGGPGQADYCAANVFLDAFARDRSARRGRTVAIDWGEWQWDAWGGGLRGFAPEIREFLRDTRRRFGIAFDEGTEILERTLAADFHQLIVSPIRLEALVRLARSVTAGGLPREAVADEPARTLHPRPVLGTAYAAPATEAERRLATIWERTLGLEEVGRDDDFFELGGHSLLATQLFSRIREAFGVDLPLDEIFETPTLRGLAGTLEASSPVPPEAGATEGIRPVPREGPLRPSFAQERLWFLDRLEPDNPYYSDPDAFRIEGALDVASLHRTLSELVRRHEILRTTFAEADGRPVQVIHPCTPVALPRIDLSALPAENRERIARQLARREARRPFDLARGPLLRVTLLHLDRDQHVLLFVTHHVVNDGWSAGIIKTETAAVYEAFRAGRPSPLPELPLQYADFAAWQRDRLRGDALETQLAYWKRRVGGGLSELALPYDRPRPARPSYRGGLERFGFSPALSKSLGAFGQERGATLFMTLLAAFQTLLHRLTGQDDIAVGTDVAGRNRAETETLIGFFVNVLLMRTDLGGDPSFEKLLERVRDVALGAYAHQDLPFEKLVDELLPERASAAAPFFQTLFVMQNAASATLEMPGLVFRPFEIDNGAVKFDLVITVFEAEDRVYGAWKYSRDLFDRETVRLLMRKFENLLRHAVSRPEARLSELELRSASERKQEAMDREKRRRAEGKKLRFARRKAVDLSRIDPVEMTTFTPDQLLPLCIEPRSADVDLIDWVTHHRPLLEEKVLARGALLFRGFGIGSIPDFERFTRAICPELFGGYGDLPRERFGGDIYTSTPYPEDQVILFHNESSQMHHWPLKQWFFCVTPAREGGETPIADGREVYRRLDPALRKLFAERGVKYVRNFVDDFDVSWQEFFRTDDRARVEAYCHEADLGVEWTEKGLRTEKVNPAVALHPKSGEAVFFNQIQAHHISCVDAEVRESLLSLFEETYLPRNVYFGDGTPIEDSMMDEIRGLYSELAVSFPWQSGDILMVDNMLTAHSRNAYKGPRKIAVAMGEMVASREIALPAE